MKIKLPAFRVPSWRMMRVLSLVAGLSCVALAVVADARWLAMFDSGIAGFNFAAALYAGMQMRQMEHVERMSAAFDEMVQLNMAMIEDRVSFHVMNPGRPDQPTLN